MLSRKISAIVAAGALLVCGASGHATIMETVPVGNPGNAGELSGLGAGGGGPDRICGAVDYTYNIGKYLVTAGQYTAFLNAVAATDTYGLYNENMAHPAWGSGISRDGAPGSYNYTVDPAFVNRPVNHVSWGDAARFANWLHNSQPTGPQGPGTTETGAYTLNGAMTNAALMAITRNADWKWAIPTEDEWYKAAYYNPVTSSYYGYPTSSDSVPGRDLNDVSGNNANYYGDPYPIDDPYFTTGVGQFQNSASPYGTFDQGGNVWEWNESTLYGGSLRGLRGGSFIDVDVHMHAAWRYSHYATTEHSSIGFRVAEVPEPTSLAILALGSVGLLVRRKGQVG